ncbi:dynein axonemal light chain 1 isoform X2 [Betta splendens]|uniref:Dynein axonemal light chain 1 n=1 Tax=Betta splendens TaxID=158456 RepID=A0A9W2XHQ9_BETSP|nr:dynein axonemal light chain 1 isoform X2 [Betta splendens]
MAKSTTVKEALAKWIPPIEKMDASLSTLTNCEKLSLSTNCIEKISNLNGLKNLKILSLGRNNIKSLSGLEAVGDTLEELWISYNLIEKLKGIQSLKNLKVLYMSNNLVKEWSEFVRLAELPYLTDLVFVGNPVEEKHSAEGNWMDEAIKRLPLLKKLDVAAFEEETTILAVGDLKALLGKVLGKQEMEGTLRSAQMNAYAGERDSGGARAKGETRRSGVRQGVQEKVGPRPTRMSVQGGQGDVESSSSSRLSHLVSSEPLC